MYISRFKPTWYSSWPSVIHPFAPKYLNIRIFASVRHYIGVRWQWTTKVLSMFYSSSFTVDWFVPKFLSRMQSTMLFCNHLPMNTQKDSNAPLTFICLSVSLSLSLSLRLALLQPVLAHSGSSWVIGVMESRSVTMQPVPWPTLLPMAHRPGQFLIHHGSRCSTTWNVPSPLGS